MADKIDTKVNLCDTCILHIAECETTISDIEFGNGKGNDNIYLCKKYMCYGSGNLN